MGVIIILLVILYLANRKKSKKHRRNYSGKSAWEKECDEGGKFFGW